VKKLKPLIKKEALLVIVLCLFIVSVLPHFFMSNTQRVVTEMDVELYKTTIFSTYFLHSLIEWISILIAIITAIISLMLPKVSQKEILSIIGAALLFSGIVDGMHVLISHGLLQISADYSQLIPFTGVISRLFNASIISFGLFILLQKKTHLFKYKYLSLNTFVILAGITTIGIIYGCLTVTHLQLNYDPNALFIRPWEIVPLLIYLVTSIILLPKICKTFPSIFIYSIFLSMIPNIFSQIYMTFISTEPYDSAYFMAHYLKLLAYLVPLLGLIYDYRKTVIQLKKTTLQINDVLAGLNESFIVSAVDIQGTITFANEYFSKISKYTNDELIGSSHRIINSGYHSPFFWASFWKTITQGDIWRGEIKNKSKDGSYYWTNATIIPQKDTLGTITQYMAIRFDITKQKVLEETHNQLKDATIIVNPDLTIQSINMATIDLLNDANIVGKPLHTIFQEQNSFTKTGLEKLFIDGSIKELQRTIKTNYNDPIPVLLSGRSVYNSDKICLYFIITLKDLRKLKEYAIERLAEVSSVIQKVALGDFSEKIKISKFEDEFTEHFVGLSFMMDDLEEMTNENKVLVDRLKFINQTLDETVTEKTKSLQEAYQSLKSTQFQLVQSSKLAALGKLGTGISHELNQPLTGILNFSKMMLEDVSEDSPIREDIKVIRNQALRMSGIVNQITTFAKPTTLEIKSLDIRDVITNALSLLNIQLKEHSIKITVSIENHYSQVLADSNSLQQVFINLIANAKDAIDALPGKPGGEITISSKNNGESEDNLRFFCISDNGISISKKHRDKLFDPFFTLKEEGKGTGLGLSISHGIMRDMKGDIQFKVSNKEVKMFIVTLKRG
jgi:PAS domain S-box-containing protein